VAPRVRPAKIDVGALRDVVVAAQVTDVCEIAPLVCSEDLVGTEIRLTSRLEENPGIGNQPRD
jgi:hypothetical protein